MNRLNLLFFALLISFVHNYYSEFNTIFLESFLFLFVAEYLSVTFYNCFRRRSSTNQDDDDSSVSDIEEENDNKTEDKTEEKKTEEESGDKVEVESKQTIELTEQITEQKAVKESSEETPEESDSETEDSSDEPVDIAEGVDVSQMEILRLLNNYESLGDSGLMELKNKMLELDKIVEFYKNDTKKAKKE
jgi:hypothetical protein